MTKQQKDTIINEFYKYPNNTNANWMIVFDKTIDKFKWEKQDSLIRKKFVEHKTRRRVCKEIGIEERTYYYWLETILQIAYLWAKELKLL